MKLYISHEQFSANDESIIKQELASDMIDSFMIYFFK